MTAINSGLKIQVPVHVFVGALSLVALACSSGNGGSPDPGADDSGPGETTVEPDVMENPLCKTSEDCSGVLEPQGPCTVAVCLPGVGVCALQDLADGTVCEDGDVCSSSDQCLAGVCKAGIDVLCDDGNPCTDDTCDAEAGCLFENSQTACEDGNECTVGDLCQEGECRPGANQCACEEDADCAVYEDDDKCNGTLFCDTTLPDPACEIDPQTVVTCDTAGDTVCRKNTCLPQTGTCDPMAVADGVPCDDGNICTLEGLCTQGACATGSPVVCDDGNPCTDDNCEAPGGCLFQENDFCGECSDIDCLACSQQVQCADSGPLIDGTCCAQGDPILYLASGPGSEVVDIESDGKFVLACGGFGVNVTNVANPAQPFSAGGAAPRCQRMAFGAQLDNGKKVVYLAHHGDTWVPSPFLGTYHVGPETGIVEVNTKTEAGVLYEGMRWKDGHLYVAAHGEGIRVYDTDEQGIPDHLTTLGGFGNAWKIDVEGDYAYVADFEKGLQVVSLADPGNPVLVKTVPVSGNMRDVDAHQGRIYTALGGDGVDVFLATDPADPVFEAHIETQGSVQAVAADSQHVALASWTHVAVHSIGNLHLLGTEQVRIYPSFDEILGIAANDGIVYVGEWEGMHILQPRQGYAAPDIWIEDELLMFPSDKPTARAVIIENLGALDLEITDIVSNNSQVFSVDKTTLLIPPGGADVVEVTATPPPGGFSGNITSSIRFLTNDPDSYQNPFELVVITGDSTKIDVGDVVDSSFGFLDPSGAGQVDGLKGHVTILAYFALF